MNRINPCKSEIEKAIPKILRETQVNDKNYAARIKSKTS